MIPPNKNPLPADKAGKGQQRKTRSNFNTPACNELQKRKQWVCHANKVPMSPFGDLASVTDPATWGTFDEAMALWKNSKDISGLGFVFDGQEYTGIDIDKCIDDDGNISTRALEVVRHFDSYTEFSPSKKGLHIIVGGVRTANGQPDKRKKKVDGLECYDNARYFTFTGDVYGNQIMIYKRQEQLDEFLKKYMPLSPGGKEQTHTHNIDFNAPFPDQKHKRLCEGNERYAASWKHDRSDLEDQSLSGYDASLASLAYRDGWSDGEIIAGIIEHRRRYGAPADVEKAYRRDYIEGLLTLAKSSGGTCATNDNEDEEKTRPTIAKILIGLMSDAYLFHDKDGTAYARIPTDDHREVWPVKSNGFSQILRYRYYKLTSKAPNAQSIQDALSTLEAKAIYAGAEHEVYVRVAGMGNKVYLDLANKDWQVVEISPDGWKIINDPPVMFVRPKSMSPLPTPVEGGSIEDLRPFVNVESDDDFILYVGFLISALSPDGPYLLLALLGGHGTAKTTACRIVKQLIDPSTSALRAQPKEIRDLMITAKNSWLVGFDNLSHIQQWLSDALCRLSTGGGFSTRELYSDDEEKIFECTRPVVLNAITEVLGREDVRDRALFLHLIPISEEKRMAEKEFWRNFDKVHPGILGDLLDGVSAALRNSDSVKLKRSPRMADAAKWVTAAESAFEWEPHTFINAYGKNRKEAIEVSAECDPVIQAILELVSDKEEWKGTVSKLHRDISGMVSDEIRRTREWPKTPKALSSRIKRMASVLPAFGIKLTNERTGENRFIIIRKSPDSAGNLSSSSSSASQTCVNPFD